ncbi:MAG: YceI family protein [Kofleriaceae bacterium]|nr:YceI family protein [Kofleriaceae bacterium]
MKLLSTLVLAITVAVTPACKKKDETAPAPLTKEPAGSAAPAPKPEPTPAPAPTADANADYVTVLASHHEPKPNDPVEVKFSKFKVTKASFDPKNLEGGTATIEIDLSSLSSGSEKRDGHLKSEGYIDIAKFTTATIDIANVKKKDDTHYAADAKVSFHGVDKTYPVEFEVVETTADSVKVRGTQKFARADFNLGKEPGPEETVAKEIEIKLQLTLKKT